MTKITHFNRLFTEAKLPLSREVVNKNRHTYRFSNTSPFLFLMMIILNRRLDPVVPVPELAGAAAGGLVAVEGPDEPIIGETDMLVTVGVGLTRRVLRLKNRQKNVGLLSKFISKLSKIVLITPGPLGLVD